MTILDGRKTSSDIKDEIAWVTFNRPEKRNFGGPVRDQGIIVSLTTPE